MISSFYLSPLNEGQNLWHDYVLPLNLYGSLIPLLVRACLTRGDGSNDEMAV